MKDEVLKRLEESFIELEQAIGSAKANIYYKNHIPKDIITRLESYDGILLEQRKLAENLQDKMNLQEWTEVRRIVEIINGLSEMVREDATSILLMLACDNNDNNFESDVPVEKRRNYC